MTFTTLATVHAPTLAAGLGELLRIGDALQLAELEGCGVTLYRDDSGQLLEVAPSLELPAGVLEDVRRLPIELWQPEPASCSTSSLARVTARARLELLELLAHVTAADVLATSSSVALL